MKRTPTISSKTVARQRSESAGGARVALLWLLASTLGCFEDRIEESLVVGVRDQGVELYYEATYHDRYSHGERAERRVANHERSLLSGDNPWLRALASVPHLLRHGSEAFFDEERNGGAPELERFTAWARAGTGDNHDHAVLGHVFGHTAISAGLVREPGLIEIDLSAGASMGGTRRQRIRMERELELWSLKVATYLDEVAELWSYIEANPDRQRPVFEAVFSDLLDPTPEPVLTPAESERLKRLDEAEGAVARIFETDDDQEFSPQELSRLVFDPYPLDVIVARLGADGRALSEPPAFVEGFVNLGDGSWRARRTSLWDAYLELIGLWVAPDPLSIKVEALRQFDMDEATEPDVDLNTLFEKPPSVSGVPTPWELADAIRASLSPPSVVRIAWTG